ncbi:MAG: HAD family hydrolase [Treponema sp.]|jgi:FMN phosphatase YigB (HAD superfamily)|nr:HAD family hydrolase [Treponema sp.]
MPGRDREKTDAPPRDPPGEFRALIFDLDGTLYDSKNIARRLILARPLDAPLMGAERHTRKVFAGRVYDSAESYYQAFFLEFSKQARCSAPFARQWYFETYMPLMIRVLGRHYRPRPGAAELFAALESGNPGGREIPFAVYSDYPMTGERLKALGLAIAGVHIYGPEDLGAQKPAAAPFLRIAEDLGRAPGDILVAGDRDDTDGEGARAAGMMYFNVNADSWGRLLSLLVKPGQEQR